jgi:lantibiotic modifying enzyme
MSFDAAKVPSIDRQTLVDEAAAIGKVLISEATSEADGTISWRFGFDASGKSTPDAGIYDGRIGDAVFLAALFAATDDLDFRYACMRAIRRIEMLATKEDETKALVRSIRLGIAGVGGMIYGLVRIAQLVDEPGLISTACRLLSAIDAEAFGSDKKPDVLSGTAGCLLGLLALSDHCSDAIDRVRLGADRLMAARFPDEPSGLRAWGSPTSRRLTPGFAHGTAGIAFALLRAASALGRRDYYEAAFEGFRAESTLYRPDLKSWIANWMPVTQLGLWCWGPPGIGFSRLGAFSEADPSDEKGVSTDLRNAIASTVSLGLAPADHLCCGNFGTVDFLVEAAERLRERSLYDFANKIAGACVARSKVSGYATARDMVPAHHGAGLWKGESGIGYVLLRLVFPSRYPSLLMLG